MKVFYSWQKTTPAQYNHDFIQNVLEQAIAQLNQNGNLSLEVSLDRDTLGLPGAVAIADELLKKIEECHVFVCDTSLVTEANARKDCPNPNVLIELGYAVAHLGWDAIICVVNEAYGSREKMPFDLRHRKLLGYTLSAKSASIDEQRDNLAKELVVELQTMVPYVRQKQQSSSPINRLKLLISDPTRNIELEDLVLSQIESDYQRFAAPSFWQELMERINQVGPHFTEAWAEGIRLYQAQCTDSLALLAHLSWYGNDDHGRLVSRVLRSWSRVPPNPNEALMIWWQIPLLLLAYTCGTAACYKENWTILETAFSHRYRPGTRKQLPLALGLSEYLILSYERQLGGEIDHLTVGETIQSALRPLFQNLIYRDDEFLHAMCLFETILAFFHLQETTDTGWMPPHRSAIYGTSFEEVETFWTKIGRLGENWHPIKSGLVGSTATVQQTLEQFQVIALSYMKHARRGNPLRRMPLRLSEAYQVGLAPKR